MVLFELSSHMKYDLLLKGLVAITTELFTIQ